MPEFDLKQIEEIAEKSGLQLDEESYRRSTGAIQINLPEISGLNFVDRTANVIMWFNCSEWNKDPYKRKFIVGCVYNTLQHCFNNTYQTGRTACAHIYDIRAEQDPVKFCKYMLQKTINKAKLLRKNEIKNCGAKYDV